MRRALFALSSFGLLTACKSDDHATPIAVQWMDWPAEVASGAPFPVRLVVFAPCSWGGFSAGSSADQSAVTFAPYFLDVRNDVLCAAELRIVAGALDTLGNAPGLRAPSPRTYEVRAAADVNIDNAQVAGLPVRTFGLVSVGSPASTRRNAAGYVATVTDTLGCLRIRPIGAYRPGSDVVLENPTDTVALAGSFVRGYIHDLIAPMCGETRAFYLEARN